MKDAISAAILAVNDQPGWKYYWEQRRTLFLPDFQQYVDALNEVDI